MIGKRRNIYNLRDLRQRNIYYYLRNRESILNRIEIRQKIDYKIRELKKIYGF